VGALWKRPNAVLEMSAGGRIWPLSEFLNMGEGRRAGFAFHLCWDVGMGVFRGLVALGCKYSV